jgi:hypothetical protein
MADSERYGMPGLIARLSVSHPDYDPLMNGFDLTKLGVAVDSNEYVHALSKSAIRALLTELQATKKYMASPLRPSEL